jgi:hypothetical protein
MAAMPAAIFNRVFVEGMKGGDHAIECIALTGFPLG